MTADTPGKPRPNAKPNPQGRQRTRERSRGRNNQGSHESGGDSRRKQRRGSQRAGDERRQQRQGRGGDKRRGRPLVEETGIEYVLIHEDACLSATVLNWALPLRWQKIDRIRLLKEGLYLRREGSLHLVSRDLVFKNAVRIAVWEDSYTYYHLPTRRGDAPQRAQVGTHALFLIRSPLKDGPPWLPLCAAVQEDVQELERGLLSRGQDQPSALVFDASLNIAKDRLYVSSTSALERRDDSNQGIIDLMRWLAANPDDNSTAAAAVRAVLIDNGHGIHRLGQIMLVDDAVREEAVKTILPGLVPHLAPLLDALWEMWKEDSSEPEIWRENTLKVAHELLPCMENSHPAQRGLNLGILTTWLFGLYGIKPERQHAQPSVSLFAIARAIRKAGMNKELLSHPDAELPTFPMTRTQHDQVQRDLMFLPPEESNVERLVRALAVAEIGWMIARPSRNHLRPFAIILPRLHDSPVAFRALQSSYDYVLSLWSYRGREVISGDRGGINLNGFLFDGSPSFTFIRSMARALGKKGAIHHATLAWLREAEHPALTSLGELSELDAAALRDRAEESLNKPMKSRLDALKMLGTVELLLAVSEQNNHEPIELPPPTPMDPKEPLARSHFMYWRMFSRTAAPALHQCYFSWMDEVLPQLNTLNIFQQTETLALTRRLLQTNTIAAEYSAKWLPHVEVLLPELESEEGLFGERLQLIAELLITDGLDAAVALLNKLLHTPGRHLANLDKVLEACGRYPWSRELISHSVFKDVHTLISDDLSAAGLNARVAWVQLALSQLRGGFRLKLLLNAQRNALLINSDSFSLWYSRFSLSAIEDPVSAWIGLLEVALAVQPDEEVDTVLELIRSETSWPHSELRKLLQRHNRSDAAITWMLQAEEPDLEAIDSSLVRVAARYNSGGDLLRLALLVHTRASLGPLPSELYDAVDNAFLAWAPEAKLEAGFAQGLNAMMLLSRNKPMPAAADLLQLSVAADSNTNAQKAFTSWACAAAMIPHWRPLFEAWLKAGDDPDAQQLADALKASVESFTAADYFGRGRPPKSPLSVLLKHPTAQDLAFGNLLQGAIEALQSGAAAEQLSSSLEALSRALEALNEQDADEEAAEETAADAGDDSAETAEAADGDAGESAAAAGDAGEATKRKGQRPPKGEAAIVRWLAGASQAAARFIKGASADTIPMLERLAHPGLAMLGARRDILAPAAELARQQGFKIVDRSNALDAKFAAAREVFADSEDLRLLIATLLELATSTNRKPSLIIDNLGLAVSLKPDKSKLNADDGEGAEAADGEEASAGQDEATAELAGESEGDSDDSSDDEAHDDEPSDDDEGDDDEGASDDAEGADDEGQGDDDQRPAREVEPGEALLSSLVLRRSGYDAAAWSTALDDPAKGEIVAALLSRNPAIKLHLFGDTLRLAWGAPPRQRRSGGSRQRAKSK